MSKNRSDHDWINRDWEITLPFRILEVFLYLMLASFLIQHPRHVTDFIPVMPVDYLEAFALAGLVAISIGSAYYRITRRKTAGAFLVVDYAITGAGGVFLGVMATLLIIR